MFTKLILLVATITLLSTITTHDLCAETTVQLGANKVGITVTGLDDHMTCTLNGPVVLQLNFGETGTFNLTPRLVPGANNLTLTVTDDDNGGCFAYSYQVWTSRGTGAKIPMHSSTFGCCDTSCARLGILFLWKPCGLIDHRSLPSRTAFHKSRTAPLPVRLGFAFEQLNTFEEGIPGPFAVQWTGQLSANSGEAQRSNWKFFGLDVFPRN